MALQADRWISELPSMIVRHLLEPALVQDQSPLPSPSEGLLNLAPLEVPMARISFSCRVIRKLPGFGWAFERL